MTKGGNQYSKIIERFLKTTDRINWAKEVAVTKRLVNEFGLEFLQECTPPYKTQSMVICSTESYKNFLKTEKCIWEKTKNYKKEFNDNTKNNSIIGENLEIQNPIKNIANFLK